MVFPFTFDELKLVSKQLHRRYLADTPLEEFEAVLPFDEECNSLFVQPRSRHERTRAGAAPGANAADHADAGCLGPALT